MDSKIILAILIVALIGIVAATYQDQTSSVLETLSNVAVEEDNPEGATDILESNVGSSSDGSVNVEEDVVKPDNAANKKVTNKKTNTNTKKNTNHTSNSNNQVKPTNNNNSNNNNPTNNNNNSNNNQNNNNSNNTVKPTNNTTASTTQSNTTTYNISSSQAKQIAIAGLPSEYSNAVASNPKLSDGYYEVTFYVNGTSVGYYEIDANTGRITGGAFQNEVPNP